MVGKNRFKRIKKCSTCVPIDIYDEFVIKAKSEGWSIGTALRTLIYLYTKNKIEIKGDDSGDMQINW
jgi:hypothetical protein